MKRNMYIYFIILLCLMSILNTIYNKYMFACNEYFSMEDTQPISATNMIEWKNRISTTLCEIQEFLDSSIGFNQMTDVPFDAKDAKYPMRNDEELSINGNVDKNQRVVFDEIEIDSASGTLCDMTKWTPDLIEDKDSIIVYITTLINEYNKEVLVLEDEKVKLSAYIQRLNRFLKQYLNNELIPQCNILVGPDRETLCNANCDHIQNNDAELRTCCDNLMNETGRRNCCKKLSDPDEITKCLNKIDTRSIRILATKNVKLLINSKKDVLNVKMCNYIKKYKKIEDVRDAVIFYINKLNTIWSTNDITKTRVRLNYTGNEMVVDGSVVDTPVVDDSSVVRYH